MLNAPEHILCADIGGTTTRVALLTGQQVVNRDEFGTPKAGGPQALVHELSQRLLELTPDRATLPVSVACTGQVWPGGRVRAVNTATMPGWADYPLADDLSQRLGTRVHVLNDAKAATLAEWHAAGQPAHFMFVTISTGIGSGVIMDGQLLGLRGQPDRGLGFIKTAEGLWLEEVCSGTALGQVATTGGYSSAKELFDAAERGGARAIQLLEVPIQTLATHLSNAQTFLGLDQVALGGSVGLRSWIQQRLTALLPELQIRPAFHGADAGLLGAAAFAYMQGGKDEN